MTETNIDYKTFIKDKLIESMDYDETTISFRFKDTQQMIQIIAMADCCSESWFEIPGGCESIIGKELVSIKKGSDIDMEPSNRQEYDSNHEYHICFVDGSEFTFLLRNSSNGYYDGWIDVKIIN